MESSTCIRSTTASSTLITRTERRLRSSAVIALHPSGSGHISDAAERIRTARPTPVRLTEFQVFDLPIHPCRASSIDAFTCMNNERAAAPRVSVVMPVFNSETYVAEAVESVLGQTLRELELIVVDDGSRDTSNAILEQSARRDPRVRLIVNETNLGVRIAMNQGWQAARAPYIARMDADDVALRERLDRQVAFLDTHPSVAAVGGAMITIDAAGRRGSTVQFATENAGIRSTLMRRNCLAHPTVTMRRSALEAVGGYRVEHAEDYDLWLRLSERYQLANLSEPVTLYRQHPLQISFTGLERQTRGRLAVVASARARRAGGSDPLDGVDELTPELLGPLNIDHVDFAVAFESDCLEWAATLAGLGHQAESSELLAQAERMLGRRTRGTFEAAVELKQAAACLSARRPVAAGFHALLALRHAPRYASRRLVERLRDGMAGRRFLSRT